jgi:hypothetical protein
MNKKTGKFKILNFAIHHEFGYSVGWGDFVPVSVEDIRTRGVQIILNNLEGFFLRDTRDKSKLYSMSKMSQREQRLLERDHHVVGIDNYKDNLLRLMPMSRYPSGGYVGDVKDQIELQLPCDNEEFYQNLLEAFRRCK